ncbi:uncharacterized protein DSM5745_04227 [Aspergillus mulundensis]|uniref:Protein kinase domain-containing protein n=1 Tax=Aspergillus mulundensis TaxID=1810919 RepID=A0A3D8SCL7_9EURO|nr:Uncharacterized protein DSM5745_04227 [Aspergillus mulundensis]RDW83901.1 Uncharacterized protein DSM5745_04227 [Aspergillus mulundensis]
MDVGSIVGLVPVCYEIGAKVQQRVVIIDACWDRTKRQVDFMVRIAPIMDHDLSRVMNNLLAELNRTLSKAIDTIETVVGKEPHGRTSLLGFGFRAKKAAWVWKKDAVDAIIVDLEHWQRRFDPSWFLLMKISSPVIDSELAKARAAERQARGQATVANNPLAVAVGLRNVLPPNLEQAKSPILPYAPMEWLDICFSDVKAGRRVSGDSRWYIIDTIEVGPLARVRDISRDVRLLAAKLSQTDPLAFGLLNCKGVIGIPRQEPAYPEPGTSPGPASPEHLGLPSPSPRSRSRSPGSRDFSHFQLVFRIPEGMEVLQSLRQLLLNPDEHISLTQKIRIARELAKAVNYVHTFAFVHKNIRPESVLCFEDPNGSRSNVFLVGFDAFRAAGAGTIMAGDMSWDRNVYRHPLRQGDDPADRYRMQHDIYSLGVCLLEVGIWQSFVEYTGGDEVPPSGSPQPQFGQSYYRFQDWLREKKRKANPSEEPTSFLDSLAFKLKDYLVELARTRLPSRMGEQYTRVVVSCLTCLDDENEDFAGVDDTVSDDLVAVHFIETVMKLLDGISV